MDQNIINTVCQNPAGQAININGVLYARNDINQVLVFQNGNWQVYAQLQMDSPNSQVPPIPGMQTPVVQNNGGQGEFKSNGTECRGHIEGNIGQNGATFRDAHTGTLCCNFSMAKNSSYKGKKTTTWFQVVAYGGLAKTQQEHNFLQEGARVVVFFKDIEDHYYTDKNGVERVEKQFVARKITWCPKKTAETAYPEAANVNTNPVAQPTAQPTAQQFHGTVPMASWAQPNQYQNAGV